MRNWAVVLLAIVGLAACGSSDNGGAVVGAPVRSTPAAAGALRSEVPPSVAARGVLRVGAAVGRAPLFFYGTGTTQPAGLEFELLQGIGRELGLQVQVVNEPLGELGSDLLAHRTDVFMSGYVDIKVFEAQGFDFVDYLTGRTAALVRHSDPTRPSGPDDLCGRRVGVLGGTAQQVAGLGLETACRSRGRPAPVLQIGTDHAQLLAALAAGRVDSVLDDAVVAQYTAQDSTGTATLDVAGAAIDPLPYGVGVGRDDPQLRDAVQAALKAMVADGSYDAVLAHWGGQEAALHAIPVNAGA